MRNRMGSSLNLDTTVVGLQGHPISATGPTSGQALVFDGTDWVPTTVQTGGGGAAVGPNPPASPNEGDLWFNTGDNTLNVWNGSAWVPVDSSNAIVQINNVLPNNPATGELYWDLTTAKLFLWDGLQWVAVINTPEGIPGPAGPPGAPGPSGPTTGVGGTFVLQGQPTINQPVVMGVTDNSNAVAGQVGEFLQTDVNSITITAESGSNFTIASLTITPGDWDVEGQFVLSSALANGGWTLGIGDPNSIMNISINGGSFVITTANSPIWLTTGTVRVRAPASVPSTGLPIQLQASGSGPFGETVGTASAIHFRARRAR